MEFKKLSDVEVVESPSDASHVLIEEDGVIKKAPKTAVGGAGGSSAEPDLLITVMSGINYATLDTSTITHGSVNNVMNAIRESRVPVIKIRFENLSNISYAGYLYELNGHADWYGSYINITTDILNRNYLSFTCDMNSNVLTYVSVNTL